LLDNLELLAAGEARELAQRCSVSRPELDAMIAELRRLDPRPGLAFDGETTQSVVPDLSIERAAGGGWQIELNGETMPSIMLNAAYPQPPASDREGRRYVSERRAEARWLLRALDRRGETLLRIAHEIVARQSDFLEGGAAGIRPLSRREIAARLELHESTVGRATAGKYAATPRGVIALADFFAGRLGRQEDDAGHAPAAVRQRLKALIAGEAPNEPLSDERLANLLRAEGVSLARRTVAKYREMLRIPAAAERRGQGSLVIHKNRPKIK
jgi:RNA polymerase sigma-54 factor